MSRHGVDGDSATRAVLDELDLAETRAILYARALRHVDRATAEDLVQTTLVAALENAGSFEGRAKATSWMLGILHRKIVDHYRLRARRHALGEELSLVDEPTAPDPHASVESARYAERLARAAATLTPRERAVLGSGLEEDRAEIGERLGLSRSHLRVVWHRAAMKVRNVA